MSSSQIRKLSNFGESARDLFGGAYGYGATAYQQPMHSLGGYLLGGAYTKVADMDANQLAAYRARLAEGVRLRAVARAEKGLAPYGSLKNQPRVSRRKFNPDQTEARLQLKHLMDAEEHAAALEEAAGHPEEARYLIEDQHYNDQLYRSNKTPAWLIKKYSDPDPFGFRTAGARKTKRDAALESAKARREAMGMTKVLNPATGRMVYPDSKIGQRVIHNVGPRIRKGVDYGNRGRSVYGYDGPNPYR
jgi:hypothetical protein